MNENDLICKTVTIKSQVYKKGDLVIIDMEDCDNIEVGLIQTILIREAKVFFVVSKYTATRNKVNYFESQLRSETPCNFIDSAYIKDFKPLIKRGTSEKFVFVFHHHVSFEYK